MWPYRMTMEPLFPINSTTEQILLEIESTVEELSSFATASNGFCRRQSSDTIDAKSLTPKPEDVDDGSEVSEVEDFVFEFKVENPRKPSNQELKDEKRSLETLLNSRTFDDVIFGDEGYLKTKSLNTLPRSSKKTEFVAECSQSSDLRDILYTSSSGERLPPASVNDLRSILRSVSNSKSFGHLSSPDSNPDSMSPGRVSASELVEPKTVRFSEPTTAHRDSSNKDVDEKDPIKKSLHIVQQLLSQVGGALNNIQQANKNGKKETFERPVQPKI